MEHLHLILYTILIGAAVTQVVAAILLYNEADRIEKEADDE
jgi:hypothetical protein